MVEPSPGGGSALVSGTDPQRLFALTRPCGACPFRSDKPWPGGLRSAPEIADSLRHGQPFNCHKTLDYNEDGEAEPTARTRACAGARATVENEGGRESQLQQIAGRLGFPVAVLAPDLPVYDSLDEWVDAMNEEN